MPIVNRISKEKVINFRWDEPIPTEQFLMTTIDLQDIDLFNYYFYQTRECFTVIEKPKHIYKHTNVYPVISLPLVAADWMLKTRIRFGLPEEEGGIKSGAFGFRYILKEEYITMTVGIANWTILNFSRPWPEDYDKPFEESWNIPFALWDHPKFQALLKGLAERYPLQEGDAVPRVPEEYPFDYLLPR